MRYLSLVFLILTATAAHIMTNPAQADSKLNDEETLRHFKMVLWPQAYRTQNTELLDSMLHSSFEMLDNSGRRSNKEGEINFITNNQWNPSNFAYTIERLNIYQGKFAVIDGTGNTDTYQYKSSNYLIKEDGRWQAIGSHVSGFKTK